VHASGTHSGTQRPPTLITKRLINEIKETDVLYKILSRGNFT
jgi:hypothetical protein